MREDNRVVLVRWERRDDVAAIRHVNEQAFGRAAEVDLVDALRDRGKAVLSLVAVHVDRVVTRILLFSPVTIESGAQAAAALGLGPMAVVAGHLRQGLGFLLVRTGLEECRKAGHGCVVVLGHIGYYPRFGFVPASRYGVTWSIPPRPRRLWSSSSAKVSWAAGAGLRGINPEFAGSDGQAGHSSG